MQSFVVMNSSAVSPATYSFTFDNDSDVQLSVAAGTAVVSQDPSMTVALLQAKVGFVPGYFHCTVENPAVFSVLSGEKWYCACAVTTFVQFVLKPTI